MTLSSRRCFLLPTPLKREARWNLVSFSFSLLSSDRSSLHHHARTTVVPLWQQLLLFHFKSKASVSMQLKEVHTTNAHQARCRSDPMSHDVLVCLWHTSSQLFFLLLTPNTYTWDSSSFVKVTVKGKGEMITFWVEDKANRTPPMEDDLKVRRICTMVHKKTISIFYQ